MKALWDGDTLVWRYGWSESRPAVTANLRNFIKKYTDAYELESHKFFIGNTKHTQFRYKLDKEYKANRTDSKRPPLEKYVRSLLIAEHDAVICKKMEADDALGIVQCDMLSKGVDSVILTNDKDLDMIPGYHIDLDYKRQVKYKDKIVTRKAYKHKERYVVTDPGALVMREGGGKKVLIGAGKMWWCAQMLLGDSADNIPGMNKISGGPFGPVAVYEYLKGAKTFEECLQRVYALYKKYDAVERFHINAKLLWIKRKRGREVIYTDEILGE